MSEEIEQIMRENVQLALPVVTQILAYKIVEKNPKNWLTGGTGFFVDTGEKKILITANHVIEKIHSLNSDMDVATYIGGNGRPPLDITDWNILGSNSEMDICTFEVPEPFDFSYYGKRCCKPRTWPPSRVQPGEKAFILGFPAERRSGQDNGVIGGASGIADFVTGVGPYTFSLADETDSRKSIIIANPGQPIIEYGGMSGSPIFSARLDGWFEPVGVFVESGGIVDGIHAPYFGAYTDFIAIDGTIQTDLIPPR